MARVLLFKRAGIENVYNFVTRMDEWHKIPRDTERLHFVEGEIDGHYNDEGMPSTVTVDNKSFKASAQEFGQYIDTN